MEPPGTACWIHFVTKSLFCFVYNACKASVTSPQLSVPLLFCQFLFCASCILFCYSPCCLCSRSVTSRPCVLPSCVITCPTLMCFTCVSLSHLPVCLSTLSPPPSVPARLRLYGVPAIISLSSLCIFWFPDLCPCSPTLPLPDPFWNCLPVWTAYPCTHPFWLNIFSEICILHFVSTLCTFPNSFCYNLAKLWNDKSNNRHEWQQAPSSKRRVYRSVMLRIMHRTHIQLFRSVSIYINTATLFYHAFLSYLLLGECEQQQQSSNENMISIFR